MGITITEALAEVKTIQKRIQKKREFVTGFLWRQDGVKDPLEKDGGSPAAIGRERQAIADLEARIVAIRRGIQRATEDTVVTINGVGMSIADWGTVRVHGQVSVFARESVLIRMKTRAEQLAFALAYALRGCRLRSRTGTLSEEDRYAIADLVVAKLREHGDPWRLDEELPPFLHGPPTHGYR